MGGETADCLSAVDSLTVRSWYLGRTELTRSTLWGVIDSLNVSPSTHAFLKLWLALCQAAWQFLYKYYIPEKLFSPIVVYWWAAANFLGLFEGTFMLETEHHFCASLVAMASPKAAVLLQLVPYHTMILRLRNCGPIILKKQTPS